jgi:hypothetical protein
MFSCFHCFEKQVTTVHLLILGFPLHICNSDEKNETKVMKGNCNADYGTGSHDVF